MAMAIYIVIPTNTTQNITTTTTFTALNIMALDTLDLDTMAANIAITDMTIMWKIILQFWAVPF